jgi:cyclic pyranopterin phosphate synthase
MIRVRFFGSFRDLVGQSYIDFDIKSIALGDLLRLIKLGDGSSLYDKIVSKGNIIGPYKIFINGDLADNREILSCIVKDGDEIVITPPVSAGGMVDISDKDIVYREAMAEGKIYLKEATVKRIINRDVEKGDVIEAAKITAINAVKNTPGILPYCHPINITHIGFDYKIGNNYILVKVKVSSYERTGVEMEALTGVSAALLTIWDMVKKYEKDVSGNYPNTIISDIKVVYKKKETTDP